MKIAIDVTPLHDTRVLSHRVRGTGFYITNLKRSLEEYDNENTYTYFTRGEKVFDAANIVHIPYFEPFFLTLPKLKICKTIVTVHDLTPLVFPNHFPAGLKGKVRWYLQRALLRNVDAIITDSNASKKDIITYTGIHKEKIHVVYLAAGEEFTRIKNLPAGKAGQESRIKEIRKKYNLPYLFALYVGDATWNKNLPRIVEASIEADIPLVMAGKTLTEQSFDRGNPWNKDLDTVQKMVKSARNVLLLGFVPTADLVMLYNTATVFVMPSLNEGFGLPILEAMSCGCPVVTSKEGSIPEVAGDGAFYVDAYDKESIKSGIKKVFDDRSLQKTLGDEGMKQAANFTWKKTVQGTVDVYEEVNK